MDSELVRKLDPEAFVHKYLPNNIRVDGRVFEAMRSLSVEVGTIKSAHGSALVKLGDTSVIAAVRAEAADPLLNSPKEGFIVINMDYPPSCHSKYKGAVPNERSQLESFKLDLFLSQSKAIDLSQLSIYEGKLSWVLYVTLVCLHDNGNALDCAWIALLKALQNVELPTIESGEEGLKAIEPRYKLKLNCFPFLFTFGIFNDQILVDLNEEEEEILKQKAELLVNFPSIIASTVYSSNTSNLAKFLECSQKQIELIKNKLI